MAKGKLVRDKIPALLGGKKKVRRLKAREFRVELARKLVEEAKEFEKDRSLEELADVLEVLRAILSERKWTFARLESARKKKARARGGFKKRQFIVFP